MAQMQSAESFGPKGGVKGFDDESVWFNALPPFINSKSYYEMLLDDYNGGTPAPHPDGPANIFICPLAGPPGTQAGTRSDRWRLLPALRDRFEWRRSETPRDSEPP